MNISQVEIVLLVLPTAAVERMFSVLESSILTGQFISSLQILGLLSLAGNACQIVALFLIRFLVLCVGSNNTSVVSAH